MTMGQTENHTGDRRFSSFSLCPDLTHSPISQTVSNFAKHLQAWRRRWLRDPFAPGTGFSLGTQKSLTHLCLIKVACPGETNARPIDTCFSIHYPFFIFINECLPSHCKDPTSPTKMSRSSRFSQTSRTKSNPLNKCMLSPLSHYHPLFMSGKPPQSIILRRQLVWRGRSGCPSSILSSLIFLMDSVEKYIENHSKWINQISKHWKNLQETNTHCIHCQL